MDKKTLMIVGGIVVVLLVAGAVNRMAGKSSAERAFEAATGGDVDVDGDDVTIRTEQGTVTTSNKLPDNFPSDVPVYPESKVVSSLSSSGEGNTGNYVSLETGDDLSKVIAWYKKEVTKNGWTVTSDSMIGENLILSASKDNRALSVTVNDDNDKVVIGIAVANK